MDFDEALRRADTKRAELAEDWQMSLRWPTQSDDSDVWFVETPWCWYFHYEVVPAEGGEPEEFFGGGPIVVNKDGSEVWLMNSSHPYDQLLAYAEEHGYSVDPAWR